MFHQHRVDRVSLYGDLGTTRDQAGLAVARDLNGLIDGIASVLESGKLPEKFPAPVVKKVKNSF